MAHVGQELALRLRRRFGGALRTFELAGAFVHALLEAGGERAHLLLRLAAHCRVGKDRDRAVHRAALVAQRPRRHRQPAAVAACLAFAQHVQVDVIGRLAAQRPRQRQFGRRARRRPVGQVQPEAARPVAAAPGRQPGTGHLLGRRIHQHEIGALVDDEHRIADAVEHRAQDAGLVLQLAARAAQPQQEEHGAGQGDEADSEHRPQPALLQLLCAQHGGLLLAAALQLGEFALAALGSVALRELEHARAAALGGGARLHFGGFGGQRVGALVVAGGRGQPGQAAGALGAVERRVDLAGKRVAAVGIGLRGGPLATRLVQLAAHLEREPHADAVRPLLVDRDRAIDLGGSFGDPALPLQVVGERVVRDGLVRRRARCLEHRDRLPVHGHAAVCVTALDRHPGGAQHCIRFEHLRAGRLCVAAHQLVLLRRFRKSAALVVRDREAVVPVDERERVAGALRDVDALHRQRDRVVDLADAAVHHRRAEHRLGQQLRSLHAIEQ